MPWTGVTFLIGAAAISGLPPLNGFVSEFLIYSAGFHGALSGTPEALILAATLLISLALIGGLAAACFTKCFGIVFLGEPREAHATDVKEVSPAMRWPMVILAAGCVIIGLTAPLSLRLVFPAIQTVTGLSDASMTDISATQSNILGSLTLILFILIALTAALFLLRRFLPMAKNEIADSTWGCGYAKPTPRMQYSASSFAQPLIDLLKICLGTRNSGKSVRGFFPVKASFSSHTSDMAQEKLFVPLFHLIERLTNPLRILQHGGIHLYVLYIFHYPCRYFNLESRVHGMRNASWILPITAWLLAPLMIGIINRVKAFFAGRQGVPLLQLYFDIFKLLRKKLGLQPHNYRRYKNNSGNCTGNNAYSVSDYSVGNIICASFFYRGYYTACISSRSGAVYDSSCRSRYRFEF